MALSRRDLAALFPALVASQAAAAAQNAERETHELPSHAYVFGGLAKNVNPETHNESWQVFKGQTHDHFTIGCHITRLQPGSSPHPPHHHVNEEMFFLKDGAVEITINGVTSRLTPGSVAYVHSNELHGVKNVGDTPAQYFVLELDGQSA